MGGSLIGTSPLVLTPVKGTSRLLTCGKWRCRLLAMLGGTSWAGRARQRLRSFSVIVSGHGAFPFCVGDGLCLSHFNNQLTFCRLDLVRIAAFKRPLACPAYPNQRVLRVSHPLAGSPAARMLAISERQNQNHRGSCSSSRASASPPPKLFQMPVRKDTQRSGSGEERPDSEGGGPPHANVAEMSHRIKNRSGPGRADALRRCPAPVHAYHPPQGTNPPDRGIGTG